MSVSPSPSPAPPTPDNDEAWSGVHRFIWRYVLARTKRRDLADDIAQETVARLIEYGRNHQIATVHGLGMRIAGHLVTKHIRSVSRVSEAIMEDHICNAPLPDRVTAARQEMTLVSEALQRMPKLRREVLVRRRIRGHSCARIAQDLNLSVKAVEKHITRGLRDLGDALKGLTSHDG